MCRNWSKIDLCGPKNVHDHGDSISYFVTSDFTNLFYTGYMDMLQAGKDNSEPLQRNRQKLIGCRAPRGYGYSNKLVLVMEAVNEG